MRAASETGVSSCRMDDDGFATVENTLLTMTNTLRYCDKDTALLRWETYCYYDKHTAVTVVL